MPAGWMSTARAIVSSRVVTGAGAVSGTGPEGAGDAALALLSLSGGELGAISAGELGGRASCSQPLPSEAKWRTCTLGTRARQTK